MRKTTALLFMCCLLMSQAQADEQKKDKKNESTFSELSHKLSQNREDRLETISISLKCINSAKDIKGINLCAEAEMRAIRSKMDKFCQLPIAGIEETNDYKVFCSNKSSKSPINTGEK